MAGAILAEHAVPFEEAFEWGKEYESCFAKEFKYCISLYKLTMYPFKCLCLLLGTTFDPDDFLLPQDDFTDEEV